MTDRLQSLQAALREFSQERNWEQFHSPKNLASALSVEAAELLEHFQWLTEEQSRTLGSEKIALIAQEMADVFIYLLQLSDKLQVDLLESTRQKMQINADKYPIERSKGSMKKYTEL
jgi:NTP pyrophosphatase (non-canonical NTP hydrolase)